MPSLTPLGFVRSRCANLFAGLAILAALLPELRAAAPIAGGWLSAGLRGAYYANPDLSGEPAFSRKDPRIDFAWGSVMAPGGSHGHGFNAVGTDHYSVRWTGRLMARYAEAFVFRCEADDGVRLRLRPAGTGPWTTLIDAWSATGLASHASAATPLAAGTAYEVELDYREQTGDATVHLFWSSPGTPEAIIDPATEVTVNWGTYDENTFADAVRNGRSSWENTTEDAAGWPQGDGDYIVSEILAPFDASPLEVGRMRLTFRGRADVSGVGNGFVVPDTYAYDAGTNTSTAWVEGGDFDGNVFALRFLNTRRTAASTTADGVTDVRLMRPVAPGALSSLPEDELFHPATRSTYSERVTGLRFQRVHDQSREWSQRTSPAWPYQGTGTGNLFVYAARYGTNDYGRSMMSHEYEIMLCNETGCDYMLSVPHLATTEGAQSYVRRLARLIRHGSDAAGEPYPAPVANPHHPPLNPNLRVYVEIGNELWNFLNRSVYSPFWDHRELVEDLAAAHAADPASADGRAFAILNYDNLSLARGTDGYLVNNYTFVRRYWGYYLRLIGEAFRAEFGDSSLPAGSASPRIRPYLGYQYANSNDTARIPFEFLDAYYNNAAGAFVADPSPVNRILFAAGGAGYYGSGNPSGATSGLIANGSFEAPSAPAPVTTPPPAAAVWTFSGDAGIVRDAARASAAASVVAGTLRNDATGWFGRRFRTGANPGWVYELGRYIHAGNTRVHSLVLVRADDGTLVTYARDLVASPGDAGTFAYSPCVPVRLSPDTSYVLLAAEESGYDTFGDAATTRGTFAPGTGLTSEGAVSAVALNATTWGAFTSPAGTPADAAYGPLDLRLADPAGLGNPDARDGVQTAWIGRDSATGQNGAIELTFTAPPSADGSSTPATYGLTYRAVQRSLTRANQPDAQQLRLFAGTRNITYRGVNGQPAAFTPIFPWQRISFWIGDYYFSETFTLAPGESVTLRIEGTAATGDARCFLDDIRVTSVDAIFAGGIPDTGEATGQPNGGDYVQGIRTDARWAQAYGLHHMTYEHGWSIGGDSGASPLQEFAKFRDPRAAQTMRDALAIFQRAGGANLTLGTYSTWPVFAEGIREEGVLNPSAYPLVQGLDASWQQLPAAPDNGVPVPARLALGNVALAYNTTEPRVDTGEWLAWNIIVPARAAYRVTLATTSYGPPPAHRLTLDEATLALSGAPGGEQTLVVDLTPGLHTLKWRGLAGILGLDSLVVSLDAAPAQVPLVTSAADGDGRVRLAWTAVSGATDYLVRYGTQAGFLNQSVTVPASGAPVFAVAGLPNGIAHYFTVAARNASGAGLPSTEIGVTPFGDGDEAVVAAWDFAGQPGYAPSADATLASTRVATTALTRGPGFLQAGWAPAGCFLGWSDPWAQTLAGADAAGHFVEFTLTPQHGRRVSFSRLDYRPAFQNVDAGNPADPRGTGVAWRVGPSGAFGTPLAVTGDRGGSFGSGSLYQVNLSSFAELQDTTAPVTFRIYFHGQSPYEGGSLGGEGSDIAVIARLQTPPLTAWRDLHGLDPLGAGDLAAPAGDGVPNLVKYAFNLAPQAGDLALPAAHRLLAPDGTAGLPALALVPVPGGAELLFQYIRRRASSAPGIVYAAQRTGDLSTWAAPAEPPVVETIDDGWERVTHAEPAGAADRVFYRVQVSLP